jgi:hypothetical protein
MLISRISFAYLRRYSWSATTAPRLPPPVRPEPGAVPFNHGLRLHDRQGAQHLRSQTIQAGEYQTVSIPNVGRFGDCRRNTLS